MFLWVLVIVGVLIVLARMFKQWANRKEQLILSLLRKTRREMTAREIRDQCAGVETDVLIFLSLLLDRGSIEVRDDQISQACLDKGQIPKRYYRAKGVQPNMVG